MIAEASPAPHRCDTRQTCLAVLIGAALAVGLTIVVLVVLVRGQRIPELTRDGFDAAWERWQANGPDSYRITVQVFGRQPAEYQVTVQQGRVVTATRNGQPLSGQRTLGTWSVPGMFDTIEYDLAARERAQVGPGATQPAATHPLRLRAEFDPGWGLPARYLRSDVTADADARWVVIEFEPQTADTTSPDRAEDRDESPRVGNQT